MSNDAPTTYMEIRKRYLEYLHDCQTQNVAVLQVQEWYKNKFNAEFPKFHKEYDWSIVGLVKGPDAKEATTTPVDANLAADLEYIGITPSTTRADAYQHWMRFAGFMSQNSGIEWDVAKNKLRSYVGGVDYRYILAYLNSCLAWGIMVQKGNRIFYVGRPRKEDHPPA